ncbi:Fungal transcriptional regulatory protein, N-terminal [Penicillium camemberti]|uniref:Fungal transcriptional regulatory protein, N-terminal n=1 Tax=Penicillium camemberti (strain FM 013) TaxID=1429867 RepID=A0A0G4P6Z2_PENC3|nr:Fungal transcriptional regulatory protein, N-terminal [Penicillium camemberti]
MTRSRNVRVYRACERCRQRKLKCDQTSLSDKTLSACLQCIRAGGECILAGSRRGGDFSRFRRSRQKQNSTPSLSEARMENSPIDQHNRDPMEGDGDPIHAELTNPGDALQILARLAANDTQVPNKPANSMPDPFTGACSSDRTPIVTPFAGRGPTNLIQPPMLHSTLSETETLVIGVLGTDTVNRLVQHYASSYHTFCPLAPRKVLATIDPRKTAVEEPFLLTVILTIASKDEIAYREVHQHCWNYLKRHLLDVLLATPSTLRVGSVEGLLLLAEWVPYMQLQTGSYPNMFSMNLSAVEDNMAWSLIGQAVRHSYLLRLDKASFRETAIGETQELANRKLLAWIFVYISDRQISVRMGQSFWSRGPALSTNFTAEDFPSLQLRPDAEHKYAHVLQATIELTQILHNVHDTLYASKERRAQMVRRGDYNRYLDDFRHSISAWEGRWDGLKASPKLNCTMHIFKEYVRLYASAFSFQSLLSGAVQPGRREPAPITPGRNGVTSLFPQGIMSTAEGSYILESIDAARKILVIAVQTNSEAQIRYMPFRFYVYTVYSAVFLYKANVFGALLSTEYAEIAYLVKQFIQALEEAAISDSHIASRFASLLKRMWVSGSQCSSPSTQHFEPPQNVDVVDEQSCRYAACGSQLPEPLFIPTPDFNLFCPEFSSLESELVELGVGSLGYPV